MPLSDPTTQPDAKPICLFCGERPAVVRGQCKRCRQGTSRAIRAKYTTEQILIDAGVLLPFGHRTKRHTWGSWRERLQSMDLDVEHPISAGPQGRAAIPAPSATQPPSSPNNYAARQTK